MKSKISRKINASDAKIEYPFLGISNLKSSKGLIVLFTAPSYGFIINPGVGSYKDEPVGFDGHGDWLMNTFDVFNGKVTLQN